ncbi:aminodeoxychorismate/anthranilate synthase component II [Chloracidobacterium aggregatum]|jgi:anthranilate synthase component 2|uniref:Aminodeoxychorismate/anthranilate synthase component II n=1 Tax=Chloracidobacterium sp. N TaxID=2821540 RepID=A0ABX8B334_9BACT|nr:aminodeoxychorismate/anthranilate synthase component II [Chloracidobacterium aggregatum]QUV86512.1 aminodeoxychorismate/anthranilate synthase component II [Chloracidobacterium sp. 2]QUV89056.1 aminodeoxychorismate/anthranilate synthase component II [Chloracidobacterium sp. S]QUV92136.1 aminodeoxychorismate/anthranilate synthase component II [Chloracidobacterium sp. A]QUV95409.1 aminodeoxychorismate/anthranilate synthase component II [Chloracidobacterium sp. N]QUV98633.1 aminodeoxychorismate
MIVIVDNYDSFTFNLYQMLQMQTAEEVVVVRNDAVDVTTLRDWRPTRIVLSPGPGRPENPRDFGVCRDILLAAAGLAAPILGVCLGHQGIAVAYGGRAVQAPRIVHGKASEMVITADSPLFDGLPPRFAAMRYHSLVADEATLPDCLMVTARDAVEGIIMALQHRDWPVYGVQFHPESIGTPLGQRILANFLALTPG